MGNYRPVCRKIVEKILLEAISPHMKDKKEIWNSQHGFIQVRFCLINLTVFYNGYNDWLCQEGERVLFVFILVSLLNWSTITSL